MTAVTACRTCGTEPLENARFCHGCGSPVEDAGIRAEYKQVTVLFADVVHSMDIASAVGAERLREIMTELVNRASAVVQRFDGTVDKFTGDGIMAVFGAPVALEDHAVRACLAALGIQQEATRLAAEVKDRDGIDLHLRVGLNSGEVIAGEIGSGALGYTAVGEQVGMAQRMESGAPPGGVMLSESTARLVGTAAVLGERQMVHIKGSAEAVPAQLLLALGVQAGRMGRSDTALVGRQWELNAVTAVLDRAASGQGCVVGVAGPAGIGKSRLVQETVAMARRRGVDVCGTFCESHTSEVPFHVVARLLREATRITELDDEAARAHVGSQFADAGDDDLLLLYDLLGIQDTDTPMPNIDPDARRRRLTALINSMSLASTTPALFVIEDIHWIDSVSESMFVIAAGDKTSLAIAMTGVVSEHNRHARMRESLRLAAEQMALVESIGDPALTVGAAFAAISIKAQNGQMTDALRWAQTAVDWAAGDPAKTGLVVGYPLAMALAFRGTARWWLGRPGWHSDLDEALAIARNATDPWTVGFVNAWVYGNAIHSGLLRLDDTAMGDLEQALQVAEASGDDTVLGTVKYTFGTVLTARGSKSDRQRRTEMLAQVRDMCLHQRFLMSELPVVEAISAYDQAKYGDRDGGLSQMRKSVDDLFVRGQYIYGLGTTALLVEVLLSRGDENDLTEAESAVERLAAIPGDGWVARDIMVLRLRTLLARARGDEAGYRDGRDRYRALATSLGFEGHMKWAEAMP
jgi:class 3 adenylate cyclase